MRAYRFPQAAKQYTFQVKDLLGVDFTTHESEVNPRRSPDAVNVISGNIGSMDKRLGFKNAHALTNGVTAMTSIEYIFSQHDGASGYNYFNLFREGALFMDGQKIRITFGSDYEGQPSPFQSSYVLKLYDPATSSLIAFDYPSGYFKPRIVKLSQFLYMIIGDDYEKDKPTILDTAIQSTYFIKIVQQSQNDYAGVPPYDLGWLLENYTYAYVLDPFNTTVQTKLNIKVPTTQIARTPNGATTTEFEGANLLTSSRTNKFVGNGTATQFVVDKTVSSIVSVQTLNADGSWTSVSGSTYSGTTITLPTAPPVSPISGQDNVKITFRMNQWEYFSDVNNFKNFGYYGFNGKSDFVFFISRTESKWNRDWRMNLTDLYIDENGYTDFGSDETKIVGYGLLGNEQVIYARSNGKSSSIFMRSSNLDDQGEFIFPVRTGVPGVGAVNGDTFGTLRGDSLWQTEYGISAIVTNDITNVQSIQDRGYYVNSEIRNQDNTFSIVYQNRYYLFIDNECYIADARYKSTEKLSFSESYQYDWFYWELPFKARCAAIIKGKLYIGTLEGNVMVDKDHNDDFPYCDEIIASPTTWATATDYVMNAVVTNGTDQYICLKAHNSSQFPLVEGTYWHQIFLDGSVYQVPVIAYWTTPIMNMGDITMRKTLKNLWVRLGKYANMSARIYYSTQGIVSEKYDGIFDFSDIDFSRFTFSTDTDPSVLVTNRAERKFMSIQFKVESRDANPFSLLEIVGKYTFNNQFKG